jgi:cell division initiation protein
MELSPQQLCEVEFSEQWRGYSRDQVDDFIERVAAAVSTLQDRLRKMTERAVRAEQRALEGNEADGAARRTLVLAQRTADATVAEARETSARVIAQAQEEARAILLAAEASAGETVDAEQPTARVEIVDLEVTRSRLQADVAALEAHVNDRRSRIKDILGELQSRVDDGLEGRIGQWPSFDDRRLLEGGAAHDDDAFADDEFDDLTDMYVIEARLADEPPVEEPEPEPEPAGHLHVAPSPDEPVAAEIDDVPEPQPVFDPEPVSASHTHHDADAEAEADRRQDELAVPTSAVGDYPAHDVDDETFFASLRGALDDDAPLGPRDDLPGMLRWRDEAATAVAEAPRLYDQGQTEGRKFGLRKRRQRRRG